MACYSIQRIILSYHPDQLLHQLNPSHFRPSSISISPENIKIISFVTFSVGKEMELQRETESWLHLVLSKILLVEQFLIQNNSKYWINLNCGKLPIRTASLPILVILIIEPGTLVFLPVHLATSGLFVL